MTLCGHVVEHRGTSGGCIGPKRAPEYHVTVRVLARDRPKLAGLDVVAVEEVTPAGWTRWVPVRDSRVAD